jgi:hypothetical protein
VVCFPVGSPRITTCEEVGEKRKKKMKNRVRIQQSMPCKVDSVHCKFVQYNNDKVCANICFFNCTCYFIINLFAFENYGCSNKNNYVQLELETTCVS